MVRRQCEADTLFFVMPALVTDISLGDAQCPQKRDGRDEPGHDKKSAISK
jgi:hypothetical protein